MACCPGDAGMDFIGKSSHEVVLGPMQWNCLEGCRELCKGGQGGYSGVQGLRRISSK